MKLFLLFTISLSIFSGPASAKLLDKTVAVVNDDIIFASEVKRIKKNLAVRQSISPDIYRTTNLKNQEILKILIRKLLIRSKLAEMGHITTDEDIESYIKNVQKGMRLNRAQLEEFLASKGLTFQEYFSITKEAREYSIFYERIIKPMISITDQEVKNYFFDLNKENKTLAIKYDLVDFYLPKTKVKKSQLKDFQSALKTMSETGNLPSRFKDVQTNPMGEITEEGLTKKLKSLLKNTPEGGFSKPILMNDEYHVFFVKKKNLTESSSYLEAKKAIEVKLRRKKSKDIANVWFEREANKHYVKTF